ncbi:alkaline phosphatase PhoX, partial [Aetokthonos hydrillicola]|uniref:alkaline phosphatase PhoX n=1 Tax=Aetokthonos hydrillicola TaxID=1550245 RepID=UPI001ABBB493
VSKYTSEFNATQHFCGLYKIIEDSPNGTGTTCRWQRFAQSGEAGAELGAGFALSDNLVFDNQENLWVVIDIPSETYNGFNVGAAGTANVVDHRQTGNVANLLGTFGNSWMFFIPTQGPNAGNLIPFGHGPMRCELTGPTFVGDTLIVSVQHPGEDCPINDGTILSRDIEILDLDGIPLNSKVDYQSSKYQTQVSVALKAWIAQHYQDFLQDNRVINGNSIALKPTSMQQVSVGKLSGVRYGFIGRKQKGEVYEQHLGYVACDGTALYVISTAFNPALDTGKFETLENFERFQPHLSTIVANLRLPR